MKQGSMGIVFGGDEKKFSPTACEFWQPNRVPRSPYTPGLRFARWLHTDSEENYRQRGNKDYSIEGVGYEFNSLGYRGPEFQRERGERAVVFIGDSNTMGVGMPWDELWTSLVTTHLEQKWGTAVRQFNLAWSGTGCDYVAMMVHQCIEMLKPDAVFVLWSFVTRMMWFADTRRHVHFVPEYTPSANAKEHDAYLRLLTDSQGFFNYVRNFQFVNDRLQLLNTPYYWANLEQFSRTMLQDYLPLDRYAGRWHRVDFARDARHGGRMTHGGLADLMCEAIERDGLDPQKADRC
jgi:hypothetical protein